MAQGFLVSCIPSEGKRPKKKPKEENDVGAMIRFLRNRRPVRNFIQQYIDPTDVQPLVTVQVFNSNGYLERTVKNADAVAEFNKKERWE